jgi:hypothetical protein
VAAHEEQEQRVVLLSVACGVWLRRCLLIRRRLHDDDRFAAAAGQLGAQVIGHAPRRDADQPRARVVWYAVLWPLQGGGEERFLHGVFGCREIAEAPDDSAQNLRRQLAQQILAGGIQRSGGHASTGGALITSRTSIGMFSGVPPGPGAAEARAAIS